MLAKFAACCIGTLALASHAWAQSSPASAASSPAPVVNLQGVTVTGAQPGPPLWEVRSGGHVMWVIGSLSPLPKQATWQWTELERVIGQSSELLEEPSARLKMPPSLFNRLAMQPNARLNPGGASLRRLLTPELYARWETLRRQYMKNDDALDFMRPIVVAQKLYEAALDANGLSEDIDVADMVEKIAKRHHTRVVMARYELVVSRAPGLSGSVEQSQQEGIACLDETMHLVESDLPKLTMRANAWSTGDMKTLQGLMRTEHYEPCVVAAINGDFAHQLNIPDLPKRIEAAWLKSAQDALDRNRSTVAVLSMDQVMAPDGYLAKLRAMGYVVRPPEGLQN